MRRFKGQYLSIFEYLKRRRGILYHALAWMKGCSNCATFRNKHDRHLGSGLRVLKSRSIFSLLASAFTSLVQMSKSMTMACLFCYITSRYIMLLISSIFSLVCCSFQNLLHSSTYNALLRSIFIQLKHTVHMSKRPRCCWMI